MTKLANLGQNFASSVPKSTLPPVVSDNMNYELFVLKQQCGISLCYIFCSLDVGIYRVDLFWQLK